jgi:hypothetical protein
MGGIVSKGTGWGNDDGDGDGSSRTGGSAGVGGAGFGSNHSPLRSNHRQLMEDEGEDYVAPARPFFVGDEEGDDEEMQ